MAKESEAGTELNTLNILLSHLKKDHKFSDKQIAELVKGSENEEKLRIPLSVFSKKLSSLEVIVKYLHENSGLSIKEISKVLNRSVRTLYVTYQKAKKKFSKKLVKDEQDLYYIPAEEFKNRKFSPLEITAYYLNSEYGLSVNQIAARLERSYSTIFTILSRAKKKHEKKR